ncbi:hypothetical protein B0H14DRAFT_2560438 [Mycena olivaceomarginata]|nr:hypothetical protein B0H14DRAFT_2560438 [Mycena olivaceomarginata]
MYGMIRVDRTPSWQSVTPRFARRIEKNSTEHHTRGGHVWSLCASIGGGVKLTVQNDARHNASYWVSGVEKDIEQGLTTVEHHVPGSPKRVCATLKRGSCDRWVRGDKDELLGERINDALDRAGEHTKTPMRRQIIVRHRRTLY